MNLVFKPNKNYLLLSLSRRFDSSTLNKCDMINILQSN